MVFNEISQLGSGSSLLTFHAMATELRDVKKYYKLSLECRCRIYAREQSLTISARITAAEVAPYCIVLSVRGLCLAPGHLDIPILWGPEFVPEIDDLEASVGSQLARCLLQCSRIQLVRF